MLSGRGVHTVGVFASELFSNSTQGRIASSASSAASPPMLAAVSSNSFTQLALACARRREPRGGCAIKRVSRGITNGPADSCSRTNIAVFLGGAKLAG